jgi:hypothetical protein
MLSLALLPAVAQAFAPANGQQGIAEICTPQGMKLVVQDAVEASPLAEDAQSALGHLEHCPYCATAAHAMAPPSAFSSATGLRLNRAKAAPFFLQVQRSSLAWSEAQPRGPPA